MLPRKFARLKGKSTCRAERRSVAAEVPAKAYLPAMAE